jgi:hypothetical protein
MAMKSRSPLFERLKKGLDESIAQARGELTLKTVEVPEPPPEIDAKTLIVLRRSHDATTDQSKNPRPPRVF